MRFSLRRTCAIACAVGSAVAVDVQQNYTICNWARLRAGIVRDAVYLDGGLLWWQTAFADGSTPVVSSDGNAAGDMFRLNLSRTFDTDTTNLSALLDTMPKAGGAGNNIAPNYVDGTMFTNDGELYLYGGLPRLTDSSSGQTDDAVLGYEAYQYGPHRAGWSPGFYQGSSGDNVTRFVTNGAGASAPSENLGFYFSGMRAPNWGDIHYEDSSANVTADTLIQVDMSTMREEEWTNLTLPDEIQPRANAELVWLPVSERGVLVAVGGVTEPEEIWPIGLNQTQSSRSEDISPSFMTSIPIYDIASQQWFVQNTTGEDAPPQLTHFCSVLAMNEDASSFNIYIYGGYSGLDASDEPSDDVWVLDIPSFTWTKAYQGSASHGRSGHRCVSPVPNLMLVLGGVHQNQANCLEGGFIQVFNLNTLQFQNTYHPDDWDEYKVPEKLSSKASRSVKRQLQWASPELETIFTTKYTKEIKQYYPYETAEDPSQGSSPSNSKSSTNTVAVAVGVSVGVVILILTVALIFILRRKGLLRSSSSESSRAKQSRITRWIGGTWSTSSQGKRDDNESTSSLTPEIQQQYTNVSAQGSSDPPTPPIFVHDDGLKKKPPQEMAAVERPRPPFELATPYNQEDHPRHSGTIDYAYSAATGHSPANSQSNSRSTSSDAGHFPTRTLPRPPPPSAYPAEGPYDSHPPDETSSSSGSTLAWPLPASRPNWKRSESAASSGGDPTTQLLAPPVASGPPQYRSLSDDSTPARLRPVPQDTPNSTQSSSGPSSQSQQESTISSLVSPVGYAHQSNWGDDPERKTRYAAQRQSLMGAISPISPDDARDNTWNINGEDREARRSGEGRERWWV